jgi:hypothetical protein
VACGPCLGQSRPANLGESDPRYRYVPRIRDLSCLCVVRIWAHLGARQGRAGLQAQPPTEGSRTRQSATKRPRFGRDSRERLPMAASPGITYYSCFDYVDYWGSESHPDCTRLIPLVTSPPPAYLLSSSAAVIKPNPPPTFRCPSRTRPRRSSSPSPIYYNIPLCESFLALVSLYNLSFSVFNSTFCQTTPGPPYVAPAAFPNDPQPILSRQ